MLIYGDFSCILLLGVVSCVWSQTAVIFGNTCGLFIIADVGNKL